MTCYYIDRPEIDNCIFSQNTAETEGGAVYSSWGLPRVTNCLFVGNTAARGGAVAAVSQGTLDLEHCTFAENSSADGGAIYIESPGSSTVNNCTFAFNRAARGAGITVVTTNMSPVAIANSIIAFGAEGEGVYWDGEGALDLDCCDLFGNEGGDWVGAIADQVGTDGNISGDPHFCDAGSGDFTIRTDSPCAPEHNPDCGLVGALGIGCEVPTGIGDGQPAPAVLVEPAFPNPFNPSTTLRFSLPRTLPVHLSIHTVDGKLTATLLKGPRPPGTHAVTWRGTDDRGRPVASGTYLFMLRAGDQVETRRMTLIR